MEKTPTAGTKFLKVSVRWEEPEDVGWDRIIGGDGNYQLIPKGMEKVRPTLIRPLPYSKRLCMIRP